MPYDKIVDSAKLDGAMTATADAIRGKTGKTADIPWNESTGFASEIASISTETTPKLQTKSATPSTSAQTVKPDSGYDGLSQVTVNAMPTATQATPSISVSSAGLITASATQTAGYVAAGTKSATKQLTTQAAKTVTPSTSNQTAVASGRYTTGAVTVKGDANLKAANIAKGVSIFGVTGTLEAGSKIATGTFTDTNGNFLKSSGVTVSGLPFTPSRVLVFCKARFDYASQLLVYADSLGQWAYADFWEQEYDSDEGMYVQYYYLGTFSTDDGFTFTLTSNGFNMKLASYAEHEFDMENHEYEYIALG